MHMEGLAAARDGEGSIAHCIFPRTVLFVFRCMAGTCVLYWAGDRNYLCVV